MRSNTQSITAQVSELGRQPVAITGGADTCSVGKQRRRIDARQP